MNSAKPNLFFLVGIMGCGKSFYAKKIAAILNSEWLDTDLCIAEDERSIVSQIFEKKGEQYFRKKELEIVNNIIKGNNKNTIISTGGGTPCFNNCMSLMNENGITIWLNEDIDVIVERLLKENVSRPLIANKSKQEIKNTANKLNEERNFFYKHATHTLTSSQINFENIINIIKQYE